MTTITRNGVDQVLERAVADGAVPQVVAIAADRDGIIYEGGAGPRVAGEAGTVTADTHFRIMSMTKMVATTVAHVAVGALLLAHCFMLAVQVYRNLAPAEELAQAIEHKAVPA